MNIAEFKNFNEFISFYCLKNLNKPFYLNLKKKDCISYKYLLKFLLNADSVLSSLKIKEKDKIIILLDNSMELVIIFLSIIFSNRIFIPINPNSSLDEIRYIIKQTNPKLIITSNYKINFFKKNFKTKKKITDTYFVDALLKKRNDNLKKSLKITKNSTAQILFTSGSTGKPKGVVLTHGSMLSNLHGIHKSLNIKTKYARFLSCTPIYHNNGQFIPTLLPFILGGSTHSISPDSSLINFWPICEKFKINYSSVMATHINYFNTLKKSKKNKLISLFCGGAKLDRASQINFEKKFSIKILTNYGLTETSSIACSENMMRGGFKTGTVGKPLSNNIIKIKKKPNDEYGEIIIKGSNIFKEYLNQKKITRKKKRKGWLYTGDLGYFDKQGFLIIKDRIDNMIIVSGENIYPSDIENHLYKLNKIKLAAVTSIPDVITQNKLVLIYESKKILNKSIFFNYLIRKIVPFKIPKLIFHVSELGLQEIPKAPNKKILRQKLKKFVEDKLTKHSR